MKQISDKKRKRLNEFGTEWDLFKRRFIQLESRGNYYCMVTGKRLNPAMVMPSCFPHLLSKKNYPAFRYNLNNIGLVAGPEEHKIFDKAVNLFKKTFGTKTLEMLIESGEEVDLAGMIDIILNEK